MKLTNLLFYFLVLTNSLVLGMIISALLGMGDSQGLAGGAIILFHGLIAGIISLFVSFFLSKHLDSKTIKKVNNYLLLLFALFLMIFAYRILTLQEDIPKNSDHKPTTKVAI
jgi:uncharacterized membrane protein